MLFSIKKIIKIPKKVKTISCNSTNLILFIIKNNYFLLTSLLNIYSIKNNNKLFFVGKKNINFKERDQINIENFFTKGYLQYNAKITLKWVGYKFILKNKSILQISLGFSHLIFFKIPKNFKIHLINFSTVIITCYNNILLTKFCSTIKSFKYPDIYKGKGVLFEYDTLTLKEGKKSQ